MSDTVRDLHAQITENRAAVAECHTDCLTLEDAWEAAEVADQDALAANPKAKADSQEKVDKQLRRTRARRTGLETAGEALQVRLHQATATEIRASMADGIDERRELNSLLDAVLKTLVKALARHVEISDELSDKYAASEREANGNSRPVFDAHKFRSADLLSAVVMGKLNLVDGLRIDAHRSATGDLEDLDTLV